MTKELLMENEKMKVYVEIGPIWLDPVLYIHGENGEMKAFTTDSNEYENDLGEFMVNKGNLDNKQYELIKKIMNELADPKSVEELKHIDWVKFTLKDEYLMKLKEIDKDSQLYI